MNAVTSLDVVTCAKKYLGVPFVHQGRSTSGIDCLGLLINIAKDLKLVDANFDANGYTKQPNGLTLLEELNKYMDPVPISDMKAGNVLVVTYDVLPQHLGIIVPYRHGGISMIHASSSKGYVLETRVVLGRTMQYRASYKFRGVA